MTLDLDELTPTSCGPEAAGMCLKEVHASTLCIPKQCFVLTYCFLATKLCLAREICIMFKSFPNISIILGQFCVFKMGI